MALEMHLDRVKSLTAGGEVVGNHGFWGASDDDLPVSAVELLRNTPLEIEAIKVNAR
jgi:hypothetical protein